MSLAPLIAPTFEIFLSRPTYSQGAFWHVVSHGRPSSNDCLCTNSHRCHQNRVRPGGGAILDDSPALLLGQMVVIGSDGAGTNIDVVA